MRPDTAVPPLSGLGLEGGVAFQSGSCKIKSLFGFHLYLGKCVGKPSNLLLESLEITLDTYKLGFQFWTPTRSIKKYGSKVFFGVPFWTFFFLLKPVLGGVQERPRAFPSLFFGSKSLQERSKRLPRRFLRASASRIRFGSYMDPLLAPKTEP